MWCFTCINCCKITVYKLNCLLGRTKRLHGNTIHWRQYKNQLITYLWNSTQTYFKGQGYLSTMMWARPEYKTHELDEKSICFIRLYFLLSPSYKIRIRLSSVFISKYSGIPAHEFRVTKYIFPAGLRLGRF